MKTHSLCILAFSFFILIGSNTAQAAVEIKVSCGPAEKALAQVWSSGVTEVKVKVDSKNSADALDQFLGKGSDLVLTEPVLRPSQLKKANKNTLLYVPVALSAQVVITNLPGVPAGELKLTPQVLSDIYLGVIKNWNDPAIQKLNPKLVLPDLDLFVIHLSNVNSLNDAFPAFLAKENPQWIAKREKDKNLHWPVGQNVSDNKKALEKLRQWAGSIVVVDMAFAAENHLTGARMKNAAGQYVGPSKGSVEAALPGEKEMVLDQPAVLTKTKAKKAYPLSSVIWAVVDENYGKVYRQSLRGPALVGFLKFILSDEGQKKAADLMGAALPTAWTDLALKKVDDIQVKVPSAPPATPSSD